MWRPDIHPTRWDEMVWNNQRLAAENNHLRAENVRLRKKHEKPSLGS
jgi:hypothetical protein